MVKCNNNNNILKANPEASTLKAIPDTNTLKANPDANTLKANPALCKHLTTTLIKTTAQIMHNNEYNDNNKKDTSKMLYFAANA